MNDAIKLAKSLGGKLEKRRAQTAKTRAGGQQLPASRYMPEVPRQVRQDGGTVDRTKMSHKDVTQRVPELTEGARKLFSGDITKEDYEALVNKHKPIMPYESVPNPATDKEIFNALKTPQKEKIGKSREIPEGTPVINRLDIPAYVNHQTWVPVTHEQGAGFKAGTPLSYNSVSHVTDATLGVNEDAAMSYARNKNDKSPKGT
jgi:hypothetical protein